MKFYSILFFLSMVSLGVLEADDKPRPYEIIARANVRHMGPKGVGYETGYTTGDLFLASEIKDRWVAVLNPRAHFFNDGRFAANTGVGTRYCTDKWVFGGNVFYDYRKMPKRLDGEFDFSFQQIGVGLEALGVVDVRLNGYIPIGKKSGAKKPSFSHFNGNFAFAKTQAVAALPSIDGEVGINVDSLRPELNFYFGAGPYYLFKRKVDGFDFRSALGVRASAEVGIWKYLSIGGSITYDRNYHTRAQGFIQLSIPLGGSSDSANCTRKRLAPIRRREIIPIKSKKKAVQIGNNGSGESGKIVFVNNLNLGARAGTFEDPYGSLFDAEKFAKEGDVIYVLPGDGTTAGYDTGITLKDKQRLIGSGNAFVLEGFTIPSLTPGMTPRITNPGGTVVTLANHYNEVYGLSISGGITAISGQPTTEAIYSIHHNTLSSSGDAIIVDISSPGSVSVTGNRISSSSGKGLAITTTAASEFSIADNTLSSSGDAISLDFSAPSFASITGNRVSSSGGKGLAITTTAASEFSIAGNTLSSLDDTISLDFSAPSSASITTNRVLSSTGKAIAINLQENNSISICDNDLESLAMTEDTVTIQGLTGNFQEILRNTIRTADDRKSIFMQLSNSNAVVSYNVLNQHFASNIVGAEPSALRVENNTSLIPPGNDTYTFSNGTGDPDLFLLEVPVPSDGITSFESYAGGEATINNGAKYVDLYSQIPRSSDAK